ncbi:MAG: PfkB family carbohydrate kinase [Vicinamibacterales bacterium]
MGHLVIPAAGALDFLALGALVHRVDPGVVPFGRASTYDVYVSGGEFNCAANLSRCFGARTAIASAIVNYPIGELIESRVREMGVKPIYKRFEHDGVRGPNMALVYSDRGFGVRPPIVFYNRANEAAAHLAPGDFDWAALFGAGVRWFHSGGIFASLSDTTAALIIEAMQAAHAHGAVVSFDPNYREKLWSAAGGAAHASAVFERILEHVDVLVGGVGLAEPDPNTAAGPLGPDTFAAIVEQTVRRFPSLKMVATTLRRVHSANRHEWSAVAWSDGHVYAAPTMDLDVYDRVGSGDGFACGFIYGLLTGESPDEALKLGWAHGALVATYPGDTTMASLEEVRALAHGASAEIRR